ncbi:hypothetical protein Ocin01_18239 [Orchesella cincta]|uniref:Uncharacterized protein n=1 Tax=Orchesella cincta TaxID=48709 RepID=A0A1D2M6A4_ORCCI|nr:hypothetical protein Ocin01_18239 [Orchesella cincta]
MKQTALSSLSHFETPSYSCWSWGAERNGELKDALIRVFLFMYEGCKRKHIDVCTSQRTLSAVQLRFKGEKMPKKSMGALA